MSYRIDPSRLNTRKIHFESGQYLLRLCADLKVQLDNKQPLRADQSRLLEWSTHRKDFEECEAPIILYSQYGHYHEGDMQKHTDLLLAVNHLIIELKLRNADHGVIEITESQLDNIERMVMRLDCRERVVFY